MPSETVNLGKLMLAGFAAGVWVVVSGMFMAATFGYRDMSAAFDAIGLAIPRGVEPLVVHTLVRLVMGIGVAALFAIFFRLWSPTPAMLAAAGFIWVFGVLLPFVVVVEWGLFSWSLAAKAWAWGLGEMLIAAVIARLLYRP